MHFPAAFPLSAVGSRLFEVPLPSSALLRRRCALFQPTLAPQRGANTCRASVPDPSIPPPRAAAQTLSAEGAASQAGITPAEVQQLADLLRVPPDEAARTLVQSAVAGQSPLEFLASPAGGGGARLQRLAPGAAQAVLLAVPGRRGGGAAGRPGAAAGGGVKEEPPTPVDEKARAGGVEPPRLAPPALPAPSRLAGARSLVSREPVPSSEEVCA